MRAVIQRVERASVSVEGEIRGQIGAGFLVLIGVEEGDGDADFRYIAEKVPNLRVFEDEQGKMNRSLLDVGGELLAVSQFTLLGDARGGRRPSFITAARPETADPMYERLVADWRARGIRVETCLLYTSWCISTCMPSASRRPHRCIHLIVTWQAS